MPARERTRPDPAALADLAQAQLVRRADHELRHALARLSAEIELLLRSPNGRAPRPLPEALARMQRTVEELAGVVATCLDRAEAVKGALALEAEPFDLAEALRAEFRRRGLLFPGKAFLFEAPPCPVRGDREKLTAALGQLAARFAAHADPDEEVVVALHAAGDRVEGFIGLANARLRPEDLVAELDRPLDVGRARVDTAYVRALLERHGGSLYVARAEQDAVGYAFTVPRAEAGLP